MFFGKFEEELSYGPLLRIHKKSRSEGSEHDEILHTTDNDKQDDKEEEDREVKKVKFKSLWPAFVSGAGLFSEGYINNSISPVNSCLKRLYKQQYTNSSAISNVSALVFVGTVVGQLGFGFVSDHVTRKTGMMTANIILILFTILCACGTWGAHGSAYGLFTALTVFRFFLGIGIGAEYPTSSVIAAEFANQLPSGHRNRYFCWFTNAMIDVGYVISSFVALVLLWIFRDTPTHRLTPVWRLSIGLGAIPPISLFFMRLKIGESESYQKTRFRNAKRVPYWLVIKFYWVRLLTISLLWFVYDFSTYSFSTFSTTILEAVVPDGNMYKTFGWNVVFNLFYIPGAFLGALGADYFGPRLCVAFGTLFQGIIGFIIGGCWEQLNKHIAAFVVVFGIFQSLGEFGPGDNMGALASKTSATSIRGEYYGIAAAIGKIGAFVGTYVFPIIQRQHGLKATFQVSSSLCILSAVVALVVCPSVTQNSLDNENESFINYLQEKGYDISGLGSKVTHDEESSTDSATVEKKADTDDVKVEAKDLNN